MNTDKDISHPKSGANVPIRIRLRLVGLCVAYAFGLTGCLWGGWQLRFDFDVPDNFKPVLWLTIAWIVPLKLFFLAWFRQFSGMLTFFGIRDLFRLFGAMATSTVLLAFLRLFVDADVTFTPPRGVIFIDFVVSFAGLAAIRLGLRLYRERISVGVSSKGHAKRVAIFGAGHIGGSLARDLFTRRGLGMRPVCFFDDDSTKWRSRLHDVPVVGPPELVAEERFRDEVDEVIIALPPTASGRRIRELVKLASDAGLKCEMVPSVAELATGRVKVSQLREVQIQDLLGREPVELEMENIAHMIKDRVIMVTGAGGSIGSELCRQIASFNPKRLLLLEQCEVQLFKIERELVGRGYGTSMMPLIADVMDRERMRSIFGRFKPDAIFHAAAHKHVPIMEHQPGEAFKNNSCGTAMVADLAHEFEVGHFLLISTDKAINPTNAMGASKRLAEIYLQALAAEKGDKTKFMAVRFGNVLGSSGSVVPIFEQQIAMGGPVKVTHPDVTRYFMTIPEAVGLVLQSASQSHGGEIFVLDMGEPVKIVDLARQLIELHGQRPEEDIEIEFTGLRPGEKLFEEISHHGENHVETDHPKIMRFISSPSDIAEVRKSFAEIENNLYEMEPDQLKQLIQKSIPEYQPFLT